MRKTIKEELERLEELLRTARSLIHPMTTQDMIDTYVDPSSRKKLQEKYPKCWISVNIGRPAPLMMPVCNVMGMTDPGVIDFSLKMVNKLAGNFDCDEDELSQVRMRLQRMRNKFDKPTYRPDGMPAKRKGVTTQLLKNIRQYLDDEKLK